MRTAQMKGTQRARLSANGIDISEGSAASIQADTDWMGEMDALTIRDNANREAWGYKNQSQQYSSYSAASKAVSKSINPYMAAGTSLLSNAGTIAKIGGAVDAKWYSMGSGNASPGITIKNDPWSAYG